MQGCNALINTLMGIGYDMLLSDRQVDCRPTSVDEHSTLNIGSHVDCHKLWVQANGWTMKQVKDD
jgi:hypothetical protein